MGQKSGSMSQPSSRPPFQRLPIAEEDERSGWSDVLDVAGHLTGAMACVRSPWVDEWCSCGCFEPDHDLWRVATIRGQFERLCERSGCLRYEVLSSGENPCQWSEVRFFGAVSKVRVAEEATKQICMQGYAPLCYDIFALQHLHVLMEKLLFTVCPRMSRLLPLGPRLPGFSAWTWCRDPIIDLLKPIQANFDVALVFSVPDLSKRTVLDLQEGMIRITIAGSADKVDEAKGALEHLLRHGHHELTHPGVVHTRVVMPDWAHMDVQRWGLSTSDLRHIENNWGVVVRPPAPDQQLSEYSVIGFEPAVRDATAYLERISQRAYQHLEQCRCFGRDAIETWGLGGKSWSDERHADSSKWHAAWTTDFINTLQAGSVRACRRRDNGAPRRKRTIKAPAATYGAWTSVHVSKHHTVTVAAQPRQQKKALVACAREQNAIARRFREGQKRRRQEQRMRSTSAAFVRGLLASGWDA